MNLFKTVDEKFEDLGFIKQEESNNCVRYERYNKGYDYTQVLCFCHKENGNHLVQSYEKKINLDGLNNVVGLTFKEIKLCNKKIKELNW